MNTIHDNGKNDQSLNDDLDKLALSYQQLEQDEPPELLDQAILNSAHRAVEKKTGWMQFGWFHGLTTAAVFVLAFGIILNQRESSPVLKNDIPVNAPARLESENAAKRQSIDQLKEKDSNVEYRDDLRHREMQKPAAAFAAPENMSTEFATGENNERVMREAQPTLRAQADTLGKSEAADHDRRATELPQAELMRDELMLEEVVINADSPETDHATMLTAPASAVEPVVHSLKARANTNLSIEQELQTIIELKQSGDETWLIKLETFVHRHPDYPLPDELKD